MLRFVIGLSSVVLVAGLFNPLLPTLGDYLLTEPQVRTYFFSKPQNLALGTCSSVPFASAQVRIIRIYNFFIRFRLDLPPQLAFQAPPLGEMPPL